MGVILRILCSVLYYGEVQNGSTYTSLEWRSTVLVVAIAAAMHFALFSKVKVSSNPPPAAAAR